MKRLILCVAFLMVVFALPIWATPFTVTLDISSIAGSYFELLVGLFDNDSIIGNSSVLIDNVLIRDAGGVITPPGVIDFESGTFEGFVPDPLDPDVASIVPGGFTGGSFLLKLEESLIVNPTLTFRDFLPSTAATLQFDFELVTPSAVDSVVFFVIHPIPPFAPFSSIPGLFGDGDFLEATSAGNTLAQGVTATSTPEPSTFVLFCIGVLSMFGIAYRRRKKAA